ncbi:hypothetical protein [uncultured Fusobacterium sp.]|uniref:hypothetical protein n=1 Tax=uncultured Fusobacterium sp. TaxID=159267 RepID=UPI0027DBF2B5|nr:hypothetical protein [uncultured Fusobacterium sp.]
MIKENNNYTKIGFGAIFAVASVLFSSHAGGGFASGNQATQYFVGNGIWGVIAAIIAMALLALTIRECIIMKNSRNLKSYKELFETLYHPFDKLEWLFEIYFNIMVICAVGAVIAGAASLISANGIMGYKMAVLGVGAILLVMTIFGSDLVSKVSTVMSVCILISTFIIFFMGIKAKIPEISIIFSQGFFTDNTIIKKSILNAFTYAGFQSVVIPTMIACGKQLGDKKNVSKSMIIAFIMNSIALGMSVVMLLGWHGDFTQAGATTLPSLYICQQLDVNILYWFYNIALLLCFISTGVTTIYGFVSRFSAIKVMEKIKKPIIRRILTSSFCMIISMSVSMIGLSRIIKYGYGYCGYLGIAIIIIPFLTVGAYKNRKYAAENNFVISIKREQAFAE